MSVPTPVNLNDSTPAAPAGGELIHWQADNNIPRNVSGYTRSLGGGTIHTASYAPDITDDKKLLVFNSPIPVTITLPTPPPKATYSLFVQNIGAGLLSVDPGALSLNTLTGLQTVPSNQGFYLTTDGTNYLAEGDAFNQKVAKPPYHIVFQFTGKPAASKVVGIFTMPTDLDPAGVSFPALFANSWGTCNGLPTTSRVYTITLTRAGASTIFGTVTVATDGSFSFTGGGNLIGKDRLVATAPDVADAVMSDVAWTLAGTRSIS